MLVIGITGTIGAGKGTIVNYLEKKKGFKHFSVRGFLVKEINKRKIPVSRDSMVFVGNDLRKKHGPGYIINKLYKEAAKYGVNSVIESIRTVGEVKALKQKKNFLLFAVDADAKIRYKRIQKRASETDRVSFKEFVEDNKKEMRSNDPAKQNLTKCIEMADYVFDNNKSFKYLYAQIE